MQKYCFDVASIYYDNYVNPLAEMKATEAEHYLLCLLSFFTPTQKLSQHGKRRVLETKQYYVNVLQKTIKLQNPEMSESEVAERMGAFLCLLPSLEVRKIQ